MSRRENKVAEEIVHRAGEFIVREANPQSLITVTRAQITSDLKNVTIFVSVLPAEVEQSALQFLKRNRTDFHNYLKAKTVLRNVPTVDFEIDHGEKNRQRMDELTR